MHQPVSLALVLSGCVSTPGAGNNAAVVDNAATPAQPVTATIAAAVERASAAYVRYRPLVEPLFVLLPADCQAQVRATLDRIGTLLAAAQLATTAEEALEQLTAAQRAMATVTAQVAPQVSTESSSGLALRTAS